ncbi:hypothetical protein ACZ90_13280 [Streptomyces albus subsp. albus]|nr:hypothetical protein ACZ90_13280 [Streptomyces albus subsp. albus]
MTSDKPWHFQMTHQRTIAAPPEVVWRALMEIRMADLPMVGALLGIRRLPARLAGREGTPAKTTLYAMAMNSHFGVLDEDSPRTLRLAKIARFWQIVPKNGPIVSSEAEFDAFTEPGYAKVITSFEFVPTAGGTRVTTGTWVRANDERSRRKFTPYWMFIKPAASAIRVQILTAIQRRAVALAKTA